MHGEEMGRPMKEDKSGYTPTQRRIMNILQDWKSHSFEELRDCLNDELSNDKNLPIHMSLLRKKLRPKALEVQFELRMVANSTKRLRFYRLVRVLRDDE